MLEKLKLCYNKKVQLVSQLAAKQVEWKAMLCIFPLTFHDHTCLATNPVFTGCEKLLQKVAFYDFFLIGNQIHSKAALSKLKQYATQIFIYSRKAVLLWVFLPVRYLCWITIESFWIIHVNPQLSQKFQLPDLATRILNLDPVYMEWGTPV